MTQIIYPIGEAISDAFTSAGLDSLHNGYTVPAGHPPWSIVDDELIESYVHIDSVGGMGLSFDTLVFDNYPIVKFSITYKSTTRLSLEITPENIRYGWFFDYYGILQFCSKGSISYRIFYLPASPTWTTAEIWLTTPLYQFSRTARQVTTSFPCTGTINGNYQSFGLLSMSLGWAFAGHHPYKPRVYIGCLTSGGSADISSVSFTIPGGNTNPQLPIVNASGDIIHKQIVAGILPSPIFEPLATAYFHDTVHWDILSSNVSGIVMENGYSLSPTFIFPSYGTALVQLTGTNIYGSSTDVAILSYVDPDIPPDDPGPTMPIVDAGPPIAAIKTFPSNLFTISESSVSNATIWYWSVTSGIATILQPELLHPTVDCPNVGEVELKLTASNNGNTRYDFITLTVAEWPDVPEWPTHPIATGGGVTGLALDVHYGKKHLKKEFR
jgi:hypothetical protein